MTIDQDARTAPAAPYAASEHAMTLPDGAELFYRAWLPEAPTQKSLLLFHRGHEHSGRFQDIVEELDLKDVAIFAWDARGHGRSTGDRGYAPSFSSLVSDMECFVRHISEKFDKRIDNMVALAPSVGAVVLAAWVHDYAPPIRAMVLAAPAFRVKLYVPLAIPGLRLLRKLRGERPLYLSSYVKSKMLTHDQQQARRYDQDPLITKSIAVNVLLDLHDASKRLVADAGAIRTPTLVLVSGADWVVRKGDQERFFSRLGSPVKQIRRFPSMYHDLLHESDRRLVLDEAREFIVEALERPHPSTPLLDADRRGYTREEFDRLSQPLSLFSPKRLGFAAQKIGMATVGRLGRGVQLGWKTGFDSGRTLDYVYENRPQGSAVVGRWIDRSYLESIGWKGIRKRKIHLEQLLQSAIRRVRNAAQPVRLLDIAAGPGRYVLETLANDRGDDLSALLSDNVPANLEAGRKLAGKLGLQDKVRFQLGDAFDEIALAATEPAPNVAIVSGLYELFADNQMVLRSLRGVARAMREGGYLVYTGQPWHPQVEMIARVLINRDGAPWIMRRRTQREMDDLVRAAGFEKIEGRIDEFGIFTVSLARKGDPA
jgi:alpha-beta hydrolase superfamily lysophospholipase/SAM-dependent methyltransferase